MYFTSRLTQYFKTQIYLKEFCNLCPGQGVHLCTLIIHSISLTTFLCVVCTHLNIFPTTSLTSLLHTLLTINLLRAAVGLDLVLIVIHASH
jgi:hypothetical protein